MRQLKIDKIIMKLGKQEKPKGIKDHPFYDNYIFKIGEKKRIMYIHRLHSNLIYRYSKNDKYKNVYTLSKNLIIEIETKVYNIEE